MKTRQKHIDVLKLLQISDRSKTIRHKNKQSSKRNRENVSESLDVSDKENASNRNVCPVLSSPRTQVLSPLNERNVSRNFDALSAAKATSTPNIVRRTLFPEPVEKEAEVDSDVEDAIVIDDSDVTDTEFDVMDDMQKTSVTNIEEKVEAAPVRAKRRIRAKPVDSVQPPEDVVTQKRVIRPTFKALNSPSHRKFFARPRLVPVSEDIAKSGIKVSKKGTVVVEVPSRIVLNTENPTNDPVDKVTVKKTRKKAVAKSAKDDSKAMPAPIAPAKRGRRAGKRVERLYSEPKPVPKDIESVPKYRQEVEKAQQSSRTLRRQGSAVGDDDIYNFHPSQEVTDEPEQDDSYIKVLIERLKKRKKPPKKRKVNKKDTNLEQASKKGDEEDVEPVQVAIQKTPEANKAESVMERIRKRLSEKNTSRSILRKSGPDNNDSSHHHEKTVTFELSDAVAIESVVYPENVPSAKSPSTNVQRRSIISSPASRDISMLPPMTSPLENSPNLTSSRIIRDPIPGTSTGGWTPSGSSRIHSTPNPQRFIPSRVSGSPAQRSPNQSINSPTSPWRVNEEARVPRTTYFSLSKDLLPSYSSDVIVQDTIPFVADRSSTGTSHHSLNHSDAENVAPGPRRLPAGKTAPVGRVPLGAIEVTEFYPMPNKHTPVTQSPLIRHSITQRQLERQAQQTRTPIQIISNVPVTGPQYRLSGDRLVMQSPDAQSPDNSSDSANSNVSDCFGFDVSASIDDIPEREISVTDLKEKLHNLKQVFPLEKSVSQDVEMPPLFKSPAKQTNTLKTMFETEHQKKEQEQEQTRDDSSDSNDIEISDPSKFTKEIRPSVKLFDDPDELCVKKAPVTKRRSYAGRQKRKRIHYSDYETTDSEPDEDEEISDKHKQKRRKRAKPDVEKSEEFQKFVCEFNSMCDEVEQYELVVEPIE